MSDTSAFHVPPEGFGPGGEVSFDSQESLHISRVLRLPPGSVVEVLDGAGGVYEVRLESCGKGKVTGRVIERRIVKAREPQISVALALGRKERFRAAVEKLTELGCCRIWPLAADHIQFRSSLASQVEKLGAVAVSALKQSRQPFLTRIEQPVELAELLNRADEERVRAVICNRTDGALPVRLLGNKNEQKICEYLLVVGPEGGFSSRELALIRERKDISLVLGRYWLRSETAAISGFTLLAHDLWVETGFYQAR